MDYCGLNISFDCDSYYFMTTSEVTYSFFANVARMLGWNQRSNVMFCLIWQMVQEKCISSMGGIINAMWISPLVPLSHGMAIVTTVAWGIEQINKLIYLTSTEVNVYNNMEHSYLIPLTNSDRLLRATAVHIPQSDNIVQSNLDPTSLRRCK